MGQNGALRVQRCRSGTVWCRTRLAPLALAVQREGGMFRTTFLVWLLMVPAWAAEPPVEAPDGSFRIAQDHDADFAWTSTITFKSGVRVILEPHDLSWPASYEISPDSRKILRIQKVGSGENVGLLYYKPPLTKRSGTPSRNISALAWDYLQSKQDVKPSYYYHTGIELLKWGRFGFWFKLSGSPMDAAKYPPLDALLFYDFETSMVTERPMPANATQL